MNELLVAFITGLTTGGLSCIALQGGLLASVIADEEKEYISDKGKSEAPRARPVILFLGAKLVVYTILGFLLGSLGSFISLTPQMRGWFQVVLGIFMLGVALQILNVHPIFKYFTIQPPKSIRKFIRKQKGNTGDLGAIIMGSLTVLLPCAVTQAMMLVAIGSGSGISGAAIMFSFILGTTPVFFILGYTASRLSEKLNSAFLKIVAVLIAATAVFSVWTGSNLLGFKINLSKTNNPANVSDIGPRNQEDDNTNQVVIVGDAQEVTINITDDGYTPNLIKVKKNMLVRVKLVTNKVYGCARAFVVPELNIQKIMPKTGEDTFEFTPTKTGAINFTCSMGMYNGYFEVE